jgi:hypothetical protein
MGRKFLGGGGAVESFCAMGERRSPNAFRRRFGSVDSVAAYLEVAMWVAMRFAVWVAVWVAGRVAPVADESPFSARSQEAVDAISRLLLLSARDVLLHGKSRRHPSLARRVCNLQERRTSAENNDRDGTIFNGAQVRPKRRQCRVREADSKRNIRPAIVPRKGRYEL